MHIDNANKGRRLPQLESFKEVVSYRIASSRMCRYSYAYDISQAQLILLAHRQDGSSYIPRNANHGNSFLVSLSAQATYADESEISLVFRCHNCPTAFSPGSALTIIHSLTAPIYPAPDALNATMPVKGATFSRITIEDGDSLRSDQFSAYVKALDV